MRVLVIHQNFPGQFGHMVQSWMKRPGWELAGLGSLISVGVPGFDRLVKYTPARDIHKGQHPYLRAVEAATLRGQAAAREMVELRRRGFVPDAIVAHPGWGETLYAKDVYPDARLVHLCEWYYSGRGADRGFDPEFPNDFDDRAKVRTWNSLHALNMAQCDVAISPTAWQRDQHPSVLRRRIQVQHEGIDTRGLAPNPRARVVLPGGVTVRAGDPVVTFVARSLEPYRGFHVFMRALERIQRAHPTCRAIVVGSDEASYGAKPTDAANWRERMLREVSIDPARTHFVGWLPYRQFIGVTQVSAAYVYLTVPYVLSWSLLEAMACGAPIVASDTPPVREVIRDGVNGRLVPFLDPRVLADTVLEMLAAPAAQEPLRRQARADVQAYSREAGLAGYEAAMGVPGASRAPARRPPEASHPLNPPAPPPPP